MVEGLNRCRCRCRCRHRIPDNYDNDYDYDNDNDYDYDNDNDNDYDNDNDNDNDNESLRNGSKTTETCRMGFASLYPSYALLKVFTLFLNRRLGCAEPCEAQPLVWSFPEIA